MPPERIIVGQIIRVLDGPVAPIACAARPAGTFRPALYVGIEVLSLLQRRAGGEYDFRRFRRKLASGIRSTGLDDDGPALDRTRDVERAADRQELALVVQDVQLFRIEEQAAFLSRG